MDLNRLDRVVSAKELKAIVDKHCEALETPGEPDCVGESTSAIAKAGVKKTLYSELSPRELKEGVEMYCAG